MAALRRSQTLQRPRHSLTPQHGTRSSRHWPTGTRGNSAHHHRSPPASRFQLTPQLANGSPDPDAGKTVQQATGYDLYSFNDGTSVEFSPDGSSRNLKLGTGSTKAPTDAQALQQAGFISVGSGTNQQIYQQNGTDANGKPTYALTNASAVSNLLNNQATQTKTQLDQLTAQKQQLDNQVLADPTNQALVQQKAQLDNQYLQAQTASQNATAAKTASDNLIAQQKAPGEIAQTAATTTNTLATANKTNALLPTDVQSAQLAVAKAQQDLQNNPNDEASKLAYQNAQTAYEQAQTQDLQLKAGQPTQWTPNTTAPSTQYWDPTSQSVQTQTNPNYQPTDPGRMTVQLQQQASGMQQTLQQQVAAGKLTSDQAASQFDSWWNTNVEPMKASIAQTQATQQSAIGQQQALTGYYNAEAANLPATLAQNASDAAQKNAISMLPYTTGAGFGQALGSAMSGGWKNVNPQQIAQATTFQLPNLQEIGRQGAAAALANISPTAQMHLNTPGPSVATPAANGMPPIASLLNQSQYGFGAPSMGGAPGAPMAQPPMAPPPMAAPRQHLLPWPSHRWPHPHQQRRLHHPSTGTR